MEETNMIIRLLALAGLAISLAALWAPVAMAQSGSGREIVAQAAGAAPTDGQPPAKIVVDPPLAEPLSRGVVFIQYRTENLQVVPVFGPKAVAVSPRIGHLHVALDGASWVWAETSGGPLIIAGLPPGPHRVDVTLVNANHEPLDRRVVEFVIPERSAATSGK
jgi:hypothetical protein